MNPMGGSACAVELHGFAKSYRIGWLGGRIPAVQGLTLRLEAGQVLGLLGPNGSGKSTTLKALAGLIAPTAGECRVFGHRAGSDVARPLVGYLTESPHFPPHLSGAAFLRYCGELSGLALNTLQERVAEVLTWGGLATAGTRPIGTYSKGMVQRLGLAQAIIHDPTLILLDEPASGLDPEGRLALHRLIRELAGKGKTIVFSSHLLASAGAVCDRLAILGHGRLLLEGSAAELMGDERAMLPAPSRLEQLYLERIHAHG
jgi:ABC-2 type transport system ATP-binding protein